MSGITEAELHVFCPDAVPFLAGLNATFAEHDITTPLRICHFLAQFGEETADFRKMHEVFDYSPADLLRYFTHEVSPEQAAQLGKQPGEAHVPRERQALIADLVYAGRAGNGTAETGDGSRFRGRGPGITFKDNYAACGEALGLDLLAEPELLEQPFNAARAGGWYWGARKLNWLADQDDLTAITRAWNGPALAGLEARHERLVKAKMVWMATGAQAA